MQACKYVADKLHHLANMLLANIPITKSPNLANMWLTTTQCCKYVYCKHVYYKYPTKPHQFTHKYPTTHP